ncbi:adenylyl-sulfate kinase [Rugosibacter aromaticivorans]|uniref:adenylyl-sulfate kinase n=1 Tax=Rugosibacter aromaticivorans TaxID=1565605 RepID=UPI000ADA688C|nr:adenylyl-sulfate kinase [Rugosibacter aromaticivorans]TBR14838.1 MAG: adenylyl-sulfate kinase [Rugosibacter sp.]
MSDKTHHRFLASLSLLPPTSTNVVWHHATVTRMRREAQNGHRGAIIWLTGLSGSGKSTLAHAVEESLRQRGCTTSVLDGDNVRHGLCGDLGFSAKDRRENIRRIGEVAKLFMEAGVIVFTAFFSPYRAYRERVRSRSSEKQQTVHLPIKNEKYEPPCDYHEPTRTHQSI